MAQFGLVNYRFCDDDPHIVATMSGRKVKSRRGIRLNAGRQQFNGHLMQYFPQLTHELFVTTPPHATPEKCDKLYYQWASI